MDRNKLKKLQRSAGFKRLLRKHGIKQRKKNTFLVLILLALIGYLIYMKASIYLIIGLTVLLILLMR